MNKGVFLVIACVLFIGLIDNVSAHKAEIVGDYKINVGWVTEPPVIGIPNAIEVIITVATDFDKGIQNENHDESMKHNKSKSIAGSGVTNLTNSLDGTVILYGEKTSLVLVEQVNNGTYHGVYTPLKTGSIAINLAGELDHSEFEVTFHPEKIQKLSVLSPFQQLDIKIPLKDVECKDNYQLLFSPSDRPACVYDSSVTKMIERNWIL